MLDLVFSGRNVFLLYIVLAARFLDPLLPCYSVRFIDSSMWIRHLLGFLTLLFVAVVADTELDEYIPLGSVIAVSVIIYTWFLFSSKMTANWWLALVILLAGVYLIDIYQTREEKKRESPKTKETIGIVKDVLLGTSMIVTLVGFLIYVGEKKLEYKSDFSYVTLLLGTPTCKNTPNKTPYLESLKAAFMAKPWSSALRGGGSDVLDPITTTLLMNDEFRAVSSLS
jgi:hypothetical protein